MLHLRRDVPHHCARVGEAPPVRPHDVCPAPAAGLTLAAAANSDGCPLAQYKFNMTVGNDVLYVYMKVKNVNQTGENLVSYSFDND